MIYEETDQHFCRKAGILRNFGCTHKICIRVKHGRDGYKFFSSRDFLARDPRQILSYCRSLTISRDRNRLQNFGIPGVHWRAGHVYLNIAVRPSNTCRDTRQAWTQTQTSTSVVKEPGEEIRQEIVLLL